MVCEKDLQNNNLDHLLKKAKKHEENYEWLQAAENYRKTLDVLKDNHSIKVINFLEKMGFSFYKAAMQAPNNVEFIRRIKLAIQAYEKESRLLKKMGKEHNHILALIAYTNSCLEKIPSEKKKLLNDWWNLERQAKKEFEDVNDLHSLAKICTNLIEYSSYDWVWSASSFSEAKKIYKECLNLAEKAIPTLSKLEDEYELARAYCFVSWYYSFSTWYFESEEEFMKYNQKAQDYAKKALELSQKINDAWLISQSYITIYNVNFMVAGSPALAISPGKKILKYGEIAKDNWCMGWGYVLTAFATSEQARQLEDPDKQKQNYEKAIEMTREARKLFQKIHCVHEIQVCSNAHNNALTRLAEIETNQKTKISLIEKSNVLIRKNEEFFEDTEALVTFFSSQLGSNFLQLAKIEVDIEKKKNLLLQAKSCLEKQLNLDKEMHPFHYTYRSANHFQLAMVLNELVSIEPKITKIDLLNQAANSMNRSLKLIKKREKSLQISAWANVVFFGRYYDYLGKILQQLYFLTKDEKVIAEAIAAYKKTVFHMKKAGLSAHTAESFWHLAQIQDNLSEFHKASRNYESAAQAYDIASQKIPQLKEFYKEHSFYMQAWSQIEQARYNHSIEEYEKAMQNYQNSAKLHGSTDQWSYLASNYLAWADMEEAECLSRKENTQKAKQTFKKALEQFIKAQNSIKQKIEETTLEEEKELNRRLLESSNLRRKYCQARIQIEDAKLLDRKGEYLQSSKSYEEAKQKIASIIEKIESEAERKELEYLAILCQAWEKMALAEETASSESYLKASELFEKAKEYCYTRKASLWALGNSSFCKGLAAGVRYQINADVSEHARAKSLMKTAATNYLQAGFDNASEYAKASQRLLDAYLYMNSAETETDQEKRAKQYQMAENVLQVAAGLFMKAKQPEKMAQVKKIVSNVREEKALAISLSQVMKAPSIASTTQSFTAPTPTSEVSVGLEQFQHANVQANLIAGMKEVKVGESFCLTVEFVNAGKEPALLTRVEDFVPPDFIVVKKPEIYRLEESCLNMKGKQIAPLKLVEAKLVLQPSKKGVYQLKPTVHYLDELGQNKSLQLKSVEIKVEEVVLGDRLSTGTKELDSLLLGGIPEGYAVVLTGPPSDERELIIKNFLEAGTKEGQTSFYVTTEAVGLENLLERSGFYLFLCNPKPKVEVPDLPNVSRLRSKTDLTNLNIALLKAYRNTESSSKKRVCLDIVSDVLLRHGAEATRRWISELITDMVSKGFTILSVMNPGMHPSDQATAVVDLFDGEISLYQTEDPLECNKSLRIKKLRNQDYIKNPICLTKSAV